MSASASTSLGARVSRAELVAAIDEGEGPRLVAALAAHEPTGRAVGVRLGR